MYSLRGPLKRAEIGPSLRPICSVGADLKFEELNWKMTGSLWKVVGSNWLFHRAKWACGCRFRFRKPK